jgi:hypothetical protein
MSKVKFVKPAAKIGLVLGGYIVAIGIASAIVALHVALTDGPDSQASSGMMAFGDSLLFLAVFGCVAVVPSGAGLFFLRPVQSFWRLLSGVTLVIAATGLLAAAVYIGQQVGGSWALIDDWSAPAVLRLLVAPLFAGAFFLSGVFAPGRRFRYVLLGASLAETAVFVLALFVMLDPFGIRFGGA